MASPADRDGESQDGLHDWWRALRSIGKYIALAALLTAAASLFPPERRELIANLAAAFGMLCLALPTVRMNEQGRIIWRVKSLLAANEATERKLDTLQALYDQERADLEASLKADGERLREAERELVAGKGAWTRAVHRLLYAGYALFFASIMIRLLPQS